MYMVGALPNPLPSAVVHACIRVLDVIGPGLTGLVKQFALTLHSEGSPAGRLSFSLLILRPGAVENCNDQ